MCHEEGMGRGICHERVCSLHQVVLLFTCWLDSTCNTAPRDPPR